MFVKQSKTSYYLDRIESSTKILAKLSDSIGQYVLIFMVILVIGNIILRKFWKPIYGSYDYISFTNAVFVTLTLGYCAIKKNNVAIEFLVKHFSKKFSRFINIIVYFTGFCIFSLITKEFIVLARELAHVHEVSGTAYIPISPFLYIEAYGFGVLSLINLIYFLKSIYNKQT